MWWRGTAIGQGTTPTWPAPPRWSRTLLLSWPQRAWLKITYISRISAGASLDQSMVRRSEQDDSRRVADRDVSPVAAGAAWLRGGPRPGVPALGPHRVRASGERPDRPVAGSSAPPPPGRRWKRRR